MITVVFLIAETLQLPRLFHRRKVYEVEIYSCAAVCPLISTLYFVTGIQLFLVFKMFHYSFHSVLRQPPGQWEKHTFTLLFHSYPPSLQEQKRIKILFRYLSYIKCSEKTVLLSSKLYYRHIMETLFFEGFTQIKGYLTKIRTYFQVVQDHILLLVLMQTDKLDLRIL